MLVEEENEKSSFFFIFACIAVSLLFLPYSSEELYFFNSVLCGSSGDVNGSWPAGGPLCACFRDSACWWRSVGLCIVLSWEDQQKSEWINFIMRPFQRRQQQKQHFPQLSDPWERGIGVMCAGGDTEEDKKAFWLKKTDFHGVQGWFYDNSRKLGAKYQWRQSGGHSMAS